MKFGKKKTMQKMLTVFIRYQHPFLKSDSKFSYSLFKLSENDVGLLILKHNGRCSRRKLFLCNEIVHLRATNVMLPKS